MRFELSAGKTDSVGAYVLGAGYVLVGYVGWSLFKLTNQVIGNVSILSSILDHNQVIPSLKILALMASFAATILFFPFKLPRFKRHALICAACSVVEILYVVTFIGYIRSIL